MWYPNNMAKHTYYEKQNIIVTEVATSNPHVAGPYFTALDDAIKMLDRICVRSTLPAFMGYRDIDTWIDELMNRYTVGVCNGVYFHYQVSASAGNIKAVPA